MERDRHNWGVEGLRKKKTRLISEPTPEMMENMDRLLGDLFASETPNGFKMAWDVVKPDLKPLLVNLYLVLTNERGFMLNNKPHFMGWDGLPVQELKILDHENMAAMAAWLQETESGLVALSDASLTTLEKTLRDKAYFTTRRGKHFDRPAVGECGAIMYSSLYGKRPFANDADLLDAYNASMFAEFREVNVGTLDSFMFNHEGEFNMAWLKSQGMSEQLALNVLKLGRIFLTRLQDHPEKNKRCTIYTPQQRAAIWDAFTACQLTNADGSETMEAYAKLFEQFAAKQLTSIRDISCTALEQTFPDGTGELTPLQKAQVTVKLQQETQPARILETMISALDQATGGTTASQKVKAAMSALPMVGGNYAAGEPVREEDRRLIHAMWDKLRQFIKREYSGYRVDIASLIPERPIIVTTGQGQFAVGGKVNLSLAMPRNLASFSSTLMHEMKHAIDQNSQASVEGAAWEGAATAVERQVWPIFIQEAMADQPTLLPFARLKTEMDNVRITATTDATLKIFLREHCWDEEPDTIQFAENIVASYGYSDPNILKLRSRRAHRSWQYLEYAYGLLVYEDLIAYLQSEIGGAHRVDGFLLQACGIQSQNKDQAMVNNLRSCIRNRK
ncbi:MAG: hypothetical protein HQL55_05410 [Magnetococcales bacterium]|nr:hypothetical protein [Magnetococcales bacterium]